MIFREAHHARFSDLHLYMHFPRHFAVFHAFITKFKHSLLNRPIS